MLATTPQARPGLVYAYGGKGDDTVYVTVDGELHADGGDGTDTLDFSGSAREWRSTSSVLRSSGISGRYDPAIDWADKVTVDAIDFENVVGSAFDDTDQRQCARKHARRRCGRRYDHGQGQYRDDGRATCSMAVPATTRSSDREPMTTSFTAATATTRCRTGGGAHETLYGDAGDDLIERHPGGTVDIYGGSASGDAGSDTVEYLGYSSGVSVNLITQTMAAPAGGDRFDSVENLRGTDYADILKATASPTSSPAMAATTRSAAAAATTSSMAATATTSSTARRVTTCSCPDGATSCWTAGMATTRRPSAPTSPTTSPPATPAGHRLCSTAAWWRTSKAARPPSA